ncbi:MAG: hypothetical protein ABSE72_11395 [Bacteroidales bacterium]
MKRLLTLFFAFTVVFLISSCAILQPNQKYLIGTWKAVKAEKYNIPNTPSNTAANAQKSKNSTGEKIDSSAVARQLLNTERQFTRLIVTELLSTIIMNANKTAIKEFNGKTEHAKWKLRNNGTRLLVNSKETGKKLTIDIQHINDTSAVVVEHLPVGSLKITYKKEKK